VEMMIVDMEGKERGNCKGQTLSNFVEL